MLCSSLVVGELGLKAIEYPKVWFDVLGEAELKTFSKIFILDVGTELQAEPVHIIGDKAYVVFQPGPKYVELGIASGLSKLIKALIDWGIKNPGKVVAIPGFTLLAYLAIKIVDWQTKIVEASFKTTECIEKVLADPNLTQEQKTVAIKACLEAAEKKTDWGTIILLGAGVLAVAYILGGKK